MARFGLGSILGAGAAGAYGMNQLKGDSGFSGMWSMLPRPWESGSQQVISGSTDMAAMQGEIRRLAGMMGDMARNKTQPTVVYAGGGGRSGWTVVMGPAVAGGLILFVYCKVTGTSVFDLFYVSRSSLSAFQTRVQESMTKVWEEVRKQKEEMFRVIGSLGKKQDEMKEGQDQLMAKQEMMDERLRRVDDACYQLDAKASHTIQHVDHVKQQVQVMDNRIQDVHTGVQAANQGIYMLASAVSEVTQKIGLHNSRTSQALKNYVQSGPTWHAPALGAAGSTPPSTANSGSHATVALPALPPAAGNNSSKLSLNPSLASSASVSGLRSLWGGGDASAAAANGTSVSDKQQQQQHPASPAGFSIEELNGGESFSSAFSAGASGSRVFNTFSSDTTASTPAYSASSVTDKGPAAAASITSPKEPRGMSVTEGVHTGKKDSQSGGFKGLGLITGFART